jgi:amino acid transporter
MRLASWIFVVAAAVTALGVFLPLLEVAGHVISKRETLSLHGAANNRALVRKVLGAYRKYEVMGMRPAVNRITPHTGGRVKDYLEDADDAMDTLSGISDDDAKQAGRALLILTWFVIGLAAVMIALVFFDVVGGVYHRGRIIGALVLAVVLFAIALVVRIGCGMVVFEVNDEIGSEAVRLGIATMVMPIASITALACSIALLVLHVRSRRAPSAA